MARQSTKLNIGDEKKIGYNRYRWFACSSCGKERWVGIIRNQPRNGICVHCSDRSKQAFAMRLANLGTPRTQETKDKISQARKMRTWMYPPPRLEPLIGDLGKVNGKSCVWVACTMCGKERWVRAKGGGIPCHLVCESCTTDEEKEKLRLKELGRKHSPKRIENNRQAQIGKELSQETKDKIREASRGRVHTQKARENMSKAQKLLWANANPEYKSKIREKLNKAQQDRLKNYVKVSENRMTIQELKANDIGNVGDIVKVHRGETAKKIICELCNKTLWVRLQNGRPRNILCKSCASKEMRYRYPAVFEQARLKWQKAMRKSLHIKPNQVERKLLGILNKLYPNEWAFVGDWTLVIAGKNPDFVNINGKKQIIELYGDYWHKDDNEEERVSLFKRFGYKTLIVWERELKNEIELTKKIWEFVG